MLFHNTKVDNNSLTNFKWSTAFSTLVHIQNVMSLVEKTNNYNIHSHAVIAAFQNETKYSRNCYRMH